MTLNYTASVEDLTVYADDGTETWDMNANGEPLANTGELRGFIEDLHEQGFIDAATRDHLDASVQADSVMPSPKEHPELPDPGYCNCGRRGTWRHPMYGKSRGQSMYWPTCPIHSDQATGNPIPLSEYKR